MHRAIIRNLLAGVVLGGIALSSLAAKAPAPTVREADFDSLRLAISDLMETFAGRYPDGAKFLERLGTVERIPNAQTRSRSFYALRREALLANPALEFDKLIVLKRKRGQHGLPVNHKCNSGIKPTGYDNEITVLSPARPGGRLTTLFRPKGTQYVGEIDLHFDADRLLFTMPVGKSWQIHEIRVDGAGLRQVSRGKHADVDSFDACYLPDGGIAYASTASFHAVPCWHGIEKACAIYRMNADGSGVRQLCFDQDLDLHPAVLPTGQIVFSRWDYTGILHMYLRPLMVMNPDGTGQRALYGSNSYWPNALYYPRAVPRAPEKVVAIAAGYHGPPRMGAAVLIDTSRGTQGGEGVMQFLTRSKQSFDDTVIKDMWYAQTWPKFLHPFPLTDKHFLIAMQATKKSTWGIYLVDTFDNVLPVLLHPSFDFFEPLPVRKTPTPPIIPDRTDPKRKDAVVYLHNVYAGPGLAGVPQGTIKRLRVVAYHFGYPGLAGPDKIGCGGPWEVMRILGTVPVQADGSAVFRIPANTPLTLQPLDAEGKAVQLMRTWYTAMPGEAVSCVGCHEQTQDTPAVRYGAALTRKPSEIEPWYGPARGLDFERDVQPALDKFCVGCHNGKPRPDKKQIPDLRAERFAKNYTGRKLTPQGARRLHPAMQKVLVDGDRIRYTPAYEALLPYIRRVSIEDDVNLLVPGEFHADTSELIQMLRKGHHGVKLDAEAWDRLITWIDLNGPCHGTWNEVSRVPTGADRRRLELARLYGGATGDPEALPNLPNRTIKPVMPPVPSKTKPTVPTVPGWPFDATEAKRRQAVGGATEKSVDLGGGVTLKLVRIPAGSFVMGDAFGEADERPLAAVAIRKAFWMGTYEITNAQLRQFDPSHDSRIFVQRYPGMDGPGMPLNGATQPAVRVSWERATAFCEWLSRKTGSTFSLPTEAQWEYACRAGTSEALSYRALNANFSTFANVADKSLAHPPIVTGGLGTSLTGVVRPVPKIKGIILEATHGGSIRCDERFSDKHVTTAPVGSFRANAWGLHDMHGNAAEWTRSTYRPYPFRDAETTGPGRKAIRGGSWVDRPKRCRSAFRLSYPAWQRVHNVGFRVICESVPSK